MVKKQQAFLLPSGNTSFYIPVGLTTEIRKGYLLKSPPPTRWRSEVTQGVQWMQYIFVSCCVIFLLHFLFLSFMCLLQKSWKKRYFVLFKISEQEHQLKYFRNPDEMEKPLGGIDLSKCVPIMHMNQKNMTFMFL